MSHLPWFPLFAKDWLGSRKVRAMPRHIRSMYLDLLCEIWQQGPVPDDEAAVFSLLGEDPKKNPGAWRLLRAPLFEIEPGLLSSEFLEELRRKALSTSEKQSKRAKERWAKWRADKPSEVPRHSGGSAISDLRSQNQEKDPPPRAHAIPGAPPPDGARVLPLPEPATWGMGSIHSLWMNVVQLTPTGNSQKLLEAADRVTQAAYLVGKSDVRAHGEALCRAFVALVDGWERAQLPHPQKTVEKFLEHFAACEEVVAGKRDPAKPVSGERRGRDQRPPQGGYAGPSRPLSHIPDADEVIARMRGEK